MHVTVYVFGLICYGTGCFGLGLGLGFLSGARWLYRVTQRSMERKEAA